MFALGFGGLDGERRLWLAVEQNLERMRFVQALDVLVAVARQAELDLILAVLREGVRDQCPAACADWQALDVIFLGDVRADANRIAARGTAWTAHGEPADLLRGRDVAVEERRREVADGHIVESVA